MPKQRPPFDYTRYEELKTQGLSQRAIAQAMGMPEATLRNNLKILAQSIREDFPMDDPDIHSQASPQVNQGIPEVSQASTPMRDLGIPPLYVHPGIPDDSEESPVGKEEIKGVYQGVPALPLPGRQDGDLGPPIEVLPAVWTDLLQMLAWWRNRQQHAQELTEKLERVTYHVAPRWIKAVRREADTTGDSYAAVVNRAFKQYFEEKPT